MLIVNLDVAFAGIGQVLGRVEAFDHTVSLGDLRGDQAMFEVCVGTDLDAGRLALARGAEAVGKLYAVLSGGGTAPCRSGVGGNRSRSVLTYVPRTPSGWRDQWRQTGRYQCARSPLRS